MARAGLNLGVRDLAGLAQVSTNTITRLERGESLYPRTIEAIRTALEAAGVEFVGETGVHLLGPAAQALREREKEKQKLREDSGIPEAKFIPRDGSDLKAPTAPVPTPQRAKEK